MKRKLLICASAFALSFSAITKASATSDTLVKLGDTWKYLDDGSDQGATMWKLSSYSDASWASGPAPLGFGDPWIVTCIHSGCGSTITCAPTCGTVTITDYFRKQISIPSVAVYDSVFLDAQIDDGLILYVNGTQVWSFNMPSTFNYTTITDSIIQGATETVIQHGVIPMTGFTNGTNEIAVELHQRGATTSDATMDLRMRFRHVGSTNVTNLLNEAAFSVYPNPSKGDFTIEMNGAASANNATISVYDVAGRKVAEQPAQFIDAKANINLSSLKAGMYYARLSGENINTAFKVTIGQ